MSGETDARSPPSFGASQSDDLDDTNPLPNGTLSIPHASDDVNATRSVVSGVSHALRSHRTLLGVCLLGVCAFIGTVGWSKPEMEGVEGAESHSAKRTKLALQKRDTPLMRSSVAEVDDEDAPPPDKLPFPVVNMNDDSVPAGSGGGTVKAADALECRQSVINFVINATDAKDECEGLKKAFDKTCNSDSSRQILERKDQGGKAKKRRMLFDDRPSRSWHYQIYKASRWTRIKLVTTYNYLWGKDFFYAEDEVAGAAWEDAKYQVLNNYDTVILNEQRRSLEEAPAEGQGDGGAADGTANQDEEPTPDPVETEPKKPKEKDAPHMQSLTLPTSSQHVSGQMLSETLLLQGKDSQIKDAIKSAANQTNATLSDAAVDAVMQAKAVQDTEAVISAVLNDPTSVEARTCCASILNVFHENCDPADQEEVSDRKLFLIVFVIAFCGVVKSVIRHFKVRWLPEAAGCILVGVMCGAIMSFVPHYDISFDGNWFLRIMVPPIVFEAALSIDKRSFNRHIVPITLFAVVGTLLATVITAYIVHRGTVSLGLNCETIPFVESLTFGALISSIDPIAVLSVLGNMGMTDTDTIYVLIFGESLLNDGVAIVLFQTLVHFLDDSLVIDSEAIVSGTIHFFVVAAGSLVVGIGSGFACTGYYYIMQGCQTPLVEVLLFFCWAFIPYYVCDGIGWSGIVAVVATGVVMDLYVVGQDVDEAVTITEIRSDSGKPGRRGIFSGYGHLSDVAKTHVGFVTEILATMMETAIFAYLGVFLFSSRYHWNFWHALLAIVACCISRAIMIPTLAIAANWITRAQQLRQNCRQPARRAGNNNGVIIDTKMQLVLWVAGLRGAMSFALVEHIPLYDEVTGEGTRLKAEMKAMTSATIVFTVFVLGGYTFYMMEQLGLAPNKKAASSSSETVSLLNQARKSVSEDSFKVSDKTVRQRPKS